MNFGPGGPKCEIYAKPSNLQICIFSMNRTSLGGQPFIINYNTLFYCLQASLNIGKPKPHSYLTQYI